MFLFCMYYPVTIFMHICAPGTTPYSTTISIIMPKSYFWVCIDVESTGFSRTNDCIIQFAAYANTGPGFCSYVHTHTSIPPMITKLTGVRQSHVTNAPPFERVWTMFTQWLDAQRQHMPPSIQIGRAHV